MGDRLRYLWEDVLSFERRRGMGWRNGWDQFREDVARWRAFGPAHREPCWPEDDVEVPR